MHASFHLHEGECHTCEPHPPSCECGSCECEDPAQPSPAQQGHDYHPTEERRVLMPTPNSGKCHCLWCWQLDIMSNTSPCGFHHVVKKKRRKKSVVWRLLRVRNLLVFVFMLPKRDIPGPTYTVFSSIRLTSLYLTFFLSDSKGIFMG